MPLIRVVSRMGKPLAAPIQASFGPGSGTLGRSPDCTLVLPDQGRHISRQQARLDVAPGATSITCLSAANPLIVNGQELRHGQTRRLASGDRIHIAEYELSFEEAASPGSFSDLLPDPLPDAFSDPFARPFASPGADPFFAPSGRAESRRGPAVTPMTPGPARASIPEAFDPFAEAPVAAAAPLSASGEPPGTPGSAKDPLGLGLPEAGSLAELAASKSESLDALFDLKAGQDPLGPDSPLGGPAGETAPKGRGASSHSDAPVPDNASVLSGSFRLPQAIPPTEFGVPDDPVLSWKNESDAAHESVLPPVPGADAAEIAAITKHAFSVPSVDVDPPASRPLPDRPPPDSRDEELLQALVLGLGLAELPRAGGFAGAAPGNLTPALMRRLGELLAAASNGTVALLQARATLKQELRADVTMIGARNNNPLKFVPDGQSALNQLLAPQPARGFMEPQQAMRDAYDDLLAHQFGFVAGMRAAMQGLIGRFDPQVLESRLASKSVLDAMVPAARKARLWELFNSLFAQVSREAEDDFERLFGRAFVKAYEEQIARIESASSQQPEPVRQPGSGSSSRRG